MSNPRTADGTITEDPLSDLPIGAQLKISADLFTTTKPFALTSIENWDFFRGALLALHFGTSQNQRTMGSGVMVAPGVALAAKHVIEPELDEILHGPHGFICTGIAQDQIVIWRVHQITLIDNCDLALLTLTAASALPAVLSQATATTRLPRVGERVMFAGFRSETEDFTSCDSMLLSVKVAHGIVTAQHINGRDRTMLPGPVFEVESEALGGMSGGPAFDEAGFMIGLLSTSFGQGPAYFSLLWPALTEPISPIWPPGLHKTPVSLLDMDRRICGIQKPEAIIANQIWES